MKKTGNKKKRPEGKHGNGKRENDKRQSGMRKSNKTATTSEPNTVENDLFNQVIHLTGIPAQTIRKELKSILDRKNIDVNNLTLDQLRCVVASYLREIMGGLLDRYGKKSDPTH